MLKARLFRLIHSPSFREGYTHWILSLEDTRKKIEAWRMEYITFRPHGFLGDLTSETFIKNQVSKAKISTLA
ncbi:integrase core domain-containing protein [Parapedobacter pyrenivorans]|uniref:integrase core domain-containing protein n=1 Tax=Parapedobacter pyrenivorans TaxID=1305674 RepID=UPI0033409D1B